MESAGLPVTALAAALMLSAPTDAAPLELIATIPMPNVKGRIDHFAADVKGRRLFVAALGNDTVEVVDTAANKHLRSITGFGEPQGLLYLPDLNRLYVANGSADRVDVLDGSAFANSRRIDQLGDADNVRFDAAAKLVVVGYGKGALRFMHAESVQTAREVKLSGHPESFQLETRGTRAFVNVPTAQHIAVVDRAKGAVIATWPVTARANFPMALDEAGRRLFSGARSPALVLVYDIDSGRNVAKVGIGGDTDDVFFDAKRKRLYVICGEGRIDVLRQETPDRYVHEASIKTAPRARTGLFVPEDDALYVAAPAVDASPARILAYRVQ